MRGDDAVEHVGQGQPEAEGRGGRPRLAELVGVPGMLRERDERELHRGLGDGPCPRVPAGPDGGLALTERDDRERELLHAVRPDEPRDLRVREAGPQPPTEPRRVGQRE